MLAEVGQGVRSLEPLPAGRPTELPEFGRGTLVPVDEIVELELVDVAIVEARETIADSFQQRPELLLVVAGDELTGGAPGGPAVGRTRRAGLGHGPKPQRGLRHPVAPARSEYRRQVFVSDLRHFLDIPEDAPAPARRLAEHLTLVVRAATAGDGGQPWVSALNCTRRPGRRPCPGHLGVFRSDVPPSIEWWCTACGDEGVISGWERSPFDLRAFGALRALAEVRHVVVPADVAAALRSLMFVDTDAERLVFRATVTDEGVVLTGDDDECDELIGYVAAEANHEPDRRRQKRLDAAFTALNDAAGDRPLNS